MPWLLCGCTVPGLQAVASVAPVEQNAPSGQPVHWPALPRPSALLKVPSMQGSPAVAPSPQKEPAMHVKHAVSPASPWYVPATHLVHEPMPVVLATVPAPHAVGTEEPRAHALPAGHALQSEGTVLPVAPEYRPDSQSVGATDASRQ